MKELESNMRGIEMEGLTWGASKLVPVGYGISKLQVNVSSLTQHTTRYMLTRIPR